MTGRISDDAVAAIVGALRERPWITAAELAYHVPLAASTVACALSELRDLRGLVQSRPGTARAGSGRRPLLWAVAGEV